MKPVVQKRPAGRPSAYNDPLADEICLRLSEGESLRKICRDEHLPSRQTVLAWMHEKPVFLSKVSRARDGQADWLHDEMADLEEEVRNGSLDPHAGRVIIWSKQWRASKLAPKKYGDRQQLEHSGPDGAPVQVQQQSTVLDAKSLTWEERQTMRQILEAAQARKNAAASEKL